MEFCAANEANSKTAKFFEYLVRLLSDTSQSPHYLIKSALSGALIKKPMKKILLLVAISLISLNAFAKAESTKSGEIKIKAPKLEVGSKLKKDEDLNIQAFDFAKLMTEAEKYYNFAKAWKKIKCQPKTGFICTKWECNPRQTETYVILDKNKETVSRCEESVCETFEAEFEQTGVFVNIQTKGSIGTLIRILGDSRYKEITTVGLDAYIANGNCEIVVE